jgi:hypothetical protein
MPVPKKLRFEVLKRDSFKCRYCGRTEADGVKLHIDHVIPVSLGGRNDHENLATACADCNLGKSANMLNDPRIIGIDFKEQKKIFDTAKQSLEHYREFIRSKDAFEYDLVSELLQPMKPHFDMLYWVMDATPGEEACFWFFNPNYELVFGEEPWFPRHQKDREYMIETVRNAELRVKRAVMMFFSKLGPESVRSAAEITADKVRADIISRYDMFSYFCGICHRKIRGETNGAR